MWVLLRVFGVVWFWVASGLSAWVVLVADLGVLGFGGFPGCFVSVWGWYNTGCRVCWC